RRKSPHCLPPSTRRGGPSRPRPGRRSAGAHPPVVYEAVSLRLGQPTVVPPGGLHAADRPDRALAPQVAPHDVVRGPLEPDPGPPSVDEHVAGNVIGVAAHVDEETDVPRGDHAVPCKRVFARALAPPPPLP